MIKSKTRPLCGCCGKPIQKLTVMHWVTKKNPSVTRAPSATDHIVDQLPETREDCQRLVGDTVVTLRRTVNGAISRFGTWDGESWDTRYRYFCSNSCAADYGQLAFEKTTLRTKAWSEAAKERETAS
jgi:hypothetical protein